MSRIIPSLLKLVGDGFEDDAYATDGVHLRWMFDPRLGFPRYAFCLERRPAVGTKQGQQGVPMHSETFQEKVLSVAFAPMTGPIVRAGLAVRRPGGSLSIGPNGIALGDAPVEIDFHGGSAGDPEPYACWVRLALRVLVPGGRGAADALYENRGALEVVDRARRDYRGFPFPRPPLPPFELRAIEPELEVASEVAELLERPEDGRRRPRPTGTTTRALYRKLVRADRRYRFVSPDYLKRLRELLERHGIEVDDLWPGRGVVRTFTMELRSDRIDRVAVTGHHAWLLGVDWVRSEDLVRARDWRPVACYPMATDESDYVERNTVHFAGRAPETIADERVVDPLPHGAEPLDDPQVPPSRPPEPDELRARYLEPWRTYLEVWLEKVLADSLSGDFHQAESTITEPVTDFGQLAGDELPPDLEGMEDQTIEVQPYELLLAAASAFPTARHLGLAAIDRPLDDVEAWDYRLRGRWRAIDIAAWGRKLLRDLTEALDEIATASPWDLPGLHARYLELYFELGTTITFLEFLLGGATDGIVELWGLKLGVRTTRHDLFASPADLDVDFDGLGVPRGGLPRAVARLSWPLRERARVIIDEEIPMGAVLGRGPAREEEPFPTLLNPEHPDLEVKVPIVPEEPESPTDERIASYRDRRVEDGVDYRYGVTECDPFNRWSRFTEATFRWDNDVPPSAPKQVSARLALAGGPPALALTVSFAWPTDLFPAADHGFGVHLRRAAPPSSDPTDRAHWGRCERVAGTGTSPYEFAGDFSGSGAHDGMTVSVGFSDRTTTDSTGATLEYRDYEVTFTGLELGRDAIDRAQVWVAVGAQDSGGLQSDEVGGPARAEHVLEIPPPTPTLPEEPVRSTYGDAEGKSSFTLRWEGAADVRYVVYRANEREILALLEDRDVDTSAYDPEASPAVRAGALRSLAVQARDAFQPRSGLVPAPPTAPAPVTGEPRVLPPQDWGPLPAGPREFTDELPGELRTYTVYTLLGRSRAGVPSDWPTDPTAFGVVEVPHMPEPARPAVVRGSWRSPDPGAPPIPESGARVELLIAEPPAPPASAMVAGFEVFRARDRERAEDYRRMRPLHALTAPVYEPLPMLAGTPFEGSRAATYIDPTVEPWTTYYYRVVARAPGLDGAPTGMRSQASAVVAVSTLSGLDPAAPTILGATRAVDSVIVQFEAEAPETPVGDFVFDVVRSSDGPLLVARVTARSARTGPTTTFRIEVSDPDGLVPAGSEIAIRIRDPLGRSNESTGVIVT